MERESKTTKKNEDKAGWVLIGMMVGPMAILGLVVLLLLWGFSR